MADSTTTYDVKVKYLLDDRASKALDRIGRGANRAARANAALNRSFRRLAGLAVGAFGIKKAFDATIGFNRSLDQTRARLRTIVQLNTGRTFAESNKTAVMLMGQLREDAKSSAGTMADMVNFSAAIAGPVTRAGGSMADLRDITKGAVVAAAAFGEKAELAQLDITQALAGTLGAKDRFAKAILGPLGITAKEFNKLTEKKRLNTLKEAFNQKGIKDAAKAYQKSFDGVFSTFKSTLQEFGGKVGSKLFARLTIELQKVNKWFQKNEKQVEQFADKLADGLVKAFVMAKKIFGFIIQHKQLLLTLAKVFLVAKAVSAFTGPFAALGGALGGFAQKLGMAGAALGAFAIGASAIANSVLRKQDKRIKQTTDNPLLRQQTRILAGAGVGRGTGIQTASTNSPQNKALRAGLKDDVGAASALTGRNVQKTIARQIALGQGKFTAGDKLSAVNNVREARARGILGTQGSKVNLNKLLKNFGVGDDIQSLTGLQIAKRKAKDKFGKSLGSLDAKQIADVIRATNKGGDGELRRLQEFLTGLDRSLTLSGRTNAELIAVRLANEARRRGVSEAQIIGERFAQTGKDIVSGLATPFNSFLKFFGVKAGVKASDKKQKKDRKGQTSIGKMVIQVESNDPDKFAMGVEGLFADIAKNGAQASLAQRGF